MVFSTNCYSLNITSPSLNPNKPLTPSPSSTVSQSHSKHPFFSQSFIRTNFRKSKFRVVVLAAKAEPLRVMISGAPASGKGTQCELITKKMVKDRLSQEDSQQKGWLLDGYPRSVSQAITLKNFGFEPDLFILLEVPEEILVERVVGRRLDPVTGKIYHLTYSPPETEEIVARLTQRFDDTEEKVKLRLVTHNSNVESLLTMYEDITVRINGSLQKQDVYSQIDTALVKLLEQKQAPSLTT